MEKEQYGIEKTRSEAIEKLLGTLPEAEREKAGHALSILVDRIAENATGGDSMKGIARFTDDSEYLRTLAKIFQQISRDLRIQASLKNTEPIDQDTLRKRISKALKTRIFAAVETGDGAHETKIRRTDLSPHQNDKAVKIEFLTQATGEIAQ